MSAAYGAGTALHLPSRPNAWLCWPGRSGSSPPTASSTPVDVAAWADHAPLEGLSTTRGGGGVEVAPRPPPRPPGRGLGSTDAAAGPSSWWSAISDPGNTGFPAAAKKDGSC